MKIRKAVTFEEILEQPGAKDAWVHLKNVPEDDLERVKRHLEALANQEKPSFSWHPPSPRDARRFADHLERDAVKIRRMNLYFGSELPLGDTKCRDLPETVERYVNALKKASRSRPRQRAANVKQGRKQEMANVNREREHEIVRLLDRSVPGEEQHYYKQAADLIQAAYDAGSVDRTVHADQLRKAYDRQSLRYYLSHLKKH